MRFEIAVGAGSKGCSGQLHSVPELLQGKRFYLRSKVNFLSLAVICKKGYFKTLESSVKYV